MIKDILKLSATLLGLDEVIRYLDKNQEDENQILENEENENNSHINDENNIDENDNKNENNNDENNIDDNENNSDINDENNIDDNDNENINDENDSDDNENNSDKENDNDKEIKKQINELLTFFNFVLREVTKEYFPLKGSTELISDGDCIIKLSDINKTVTAIKDIKNELGLSTKFLLYPEKIKLERPHAKYKIFYQFLNPTVSDINENFALPLGLDYFVLSYGIASEYALSRGLYSEAELFESKFKSMLEKCRMFNSEKRFYSRKLK